MGKIGRRSRRIMGVSSPCRQLRAVQFVDRANWLALICIHICMFLLVICQPTGFAANKIKVALFEDRGASAPAKRNFENVLSNSDDIQFQTIYGDDIADGSLQGFDALIMPGGSASKEAISLGPEARAEVRRFVKDGGIYMGVCAGAYLSSEAQDNYLGLLPITTLDQKHWYRVDDGTPVNVELTATGMDVFGLKDRNISIIYENGPIFAQPTQKPDDSFTELGFFRSEVVADGGQRGVMLGAPAMILSRYGRGIVLAISPHPEKTPALRQMIVHALNWMYDHRIATTTNTQAAPVAKAKAPQQNLNTPASDLSQRALQLAQSLFDHATDVKYVHHEVPAADQISIDSDGSVEAHTDCSGFISYVVHSVAPRHYHEVRSLEPDWSYPQAKVWASFFNSLDVGQPEEGWLRLGNWHDLRPGDIIAWKEGGSGGGNTGHVMLVASRPGNVQENSGYRFVEVPVIDSSTTYHFAPENLPPNAHQSHRNGLGKGIVRLMLSDDDTAIGYWAGTYWGEGDEPVKGPTMSKLVRFARMVPMAAND